MNGYSEGMKTNQAVTDIVAVYLTSLGFEAMAQECLAGTYPPNRFVPLVLRESQKRLNPQQFQMLQDGLKAFGLIHF